MPALTRGIPGTTNDLNWFVSIGGVKNDAYEIGYRIRDITSGLPGTQVFPASGYEDVTAAPGRFATGSYYAYDVATTQGWAPGLGYNLGTHRIDWRWKAGAADPYQSGSEDFAVLAEDAAPPAGEIYVTVADIRALGITAAMADDDMVVATLAICQEFIDRACRQWFNSRNLVLELDGTDSDTIHLGVPIITINYIQINNSGTNLEDHLFKVYNARRYPDDRRNPRIKLVRSEDINSIFARPIIHGSKLKFRKGRKNQTISGSFGFIEEDGSTPKLIKRALSKLTIEKLQNPLFHDQTTGAPPVPPPPPIVGPLLEEVTDGHKQKYGQSGGTIMPRRPGLTGITNDQEIHDIVKLYKAPLGMATPAHWSFD